MRNFFFISIILSKVNYCIYFASSRQKSQKYSSFTNIRKIFDKTEESFTKQGKKVKRNKHSRTHTYMEYSKMVKGIHSIIAPK